MPATLLVVGEVADGHLTKLSAEIATFAARLAAEAGGAGSEEDGVLEGDAEQSGRRHRPPAGSPGASLRSNSPRTRPTPPISSDRLKRSSGCAVTSTRCYRPI